MQAHACSLKVSVIRVPTKTNSTKSTLSHFRLVVLYLDIRKCILVNCKLGQEGIFPYFLWRERWIANDFIFEFQFRMQ